MMTLYLTCLIAGSIFIAITLFFGADSDADADMDMELDTDLDVNTDADISFENDGFEAIKFLSIRNIVFFLAFFGLTGTLLTLLGGWWLLNVILSVVMGSVAGVLMHKSMNYLVKNEVGETASLEDLTGLPAKVMINVSSKRRGKISLDMQGQHLQLLALTAEESAKPTFKQGDSVIVLRIEDGTAQVVESEFV